MTARVDVPSDVTWGEVRSRGEARKKHIETSGKRVGMMGLRRPARNKEKGRTDVITAAAR